MIPGDFFLRFFGENRGCIFENSKKLRVDWMRLWLGSFLAVRACAAAHRSSQQGIADAVVTDVFRGDAVSKRGFWERGGETLENFMARCVFEEMFQTSGAWHHSFAFWHRILARSVESLALGGLLFSCEPLCRWISGKFSAAFAPSSSNIIWKECFNVLQVVLLLCLSEPAQIQWRRVLRTPTSWSL